jgi:hypothetical protein
MQQQPVSRVCKCKKGYVSAWDGKCGHCRTKREAKELEAKQRKHFIESGEAARVRAQLEAIKISEVEVRYLGNPDGE